MDRDVTDILGLPNAGEDVEIEKSAARRSDEALIKTYFAKFKRIKKGIVDEAAYAALKNRKWNDVAGMIVAQLMILILFPNTTQVISWKLFSYCDDVEKLEKYAWAKAVNGKLKMSLAGRPKHPGGCLLLVLPFHKKGQMKKLSAPVYDSTEVGTKVTKTKEKGHRDDTIAELMEMITELELDMVVKEQTNQRLEGEAEN